MRTLGDIRYVGSYQIVDSSNKILDLRLCVRRRERCRRRRHIGRRFRSVAFGLCYTSWCDLFARRALGCMYRAYSRLRADLRCRLSESNIVRLELHAYTKGVLKYKLRYNDFGVSTDSGLKNRLEV